MSAKYIRKEFYIKKTSIAKKIAISFLAIIVLIMQILQILLPVIKSL